MLDLGIVILNWNTRDLLRRCLASVLASRGDFSYRVCVVDNASSDGSAAMVRQEFASTQLIENSVNSGFAAGNNVGLKALGYAGSTGKAPHFCLLLNPDTEASPTALGDLLAYMRARPRVGMAGPKLVLPDGRLDLACRRSFPTPEIAFYRLTGLSRLFPKSPVFGRYNLTYLDADIEAEVDSVVGACMLVRREAVHQVGLLDERFWMYAEDLDWAFRFKQAGWRVAYTPSVTVLHRKRAASRQNPRARREFYRAEWLFYQKHFQARTPRLVHWCVMAGVFLRGGLRA